MGKPRYRPGHRYLWRAQPFERYPGSAVVVQVIGPHGQVLHAGQACMTEGDLPRTVGVLLDMIEAKFNAR